MAAIERLGGVVQYDWEMFPVTAGPPQQPGVPWLRNLLGTDFFSKVTLVDLSGSDVTDAELEHLSGLTRLNFLFLHDTQVTDAGLEHLNGLKNLVILYLNGTQVTPEGVKKLQKALLDCPIDFQSRWSTDLPP